MDITFIHLCFLQCSSIAIDTRKIEPKSLFVALKGANVDANSFTIEALKKGASYVLIDSNAFYIDERTIVVENTLLCLQELAKFHRKFLGIPIIALTGSNGKTTTKELFHAVLSQKFNTKATVGNLNNHIGVPLTILSFTKETEIGIVEMGANHQNEIDFLCQIAQPNFGYITNFGKAHLEGFGGIEGVIKGKSEMYNFIYNHRQKVFVNIDDSIQDEKTVNLERFTFSKINSTADIFFSKVEANPYVNLVFEKVIIESHLIGLYNATNIMAAIAVGKYFKIENELIKIGVESFIPENNRSQLLQINGNEIILDAYNANPSSMEVALDNFINQQKDNKAVIIGDMFELGEESEKEHQTIVSKLEKTADFNCYFVGKLFYAARVRNNHFFFFETFEDFSRYLLNNVFQNSFVLIKGSRGMALERTLQFL